MNSCIYRGIVRHRRFQPVGHSFSYRVFMMYLDLAELPGLFDGRWLWSAKRPSVAWFCRRDHLGPAETPLDEAVRNLVEERSGSRPEGPIRLLTHLRYFGYGFNPVSFYYCFDAAGERVETIVAEVSNTPWGEMHPYVLTETMNLGRGKAKRYEFDKEFHVSPFMDMDLLYEWHFTAPASDLNVHMSNYAKGDKLFDATLKFTRQEITGGALARVLFFYPLMTWKVITAIHWQALRLWLKKCPGYPHPAKRSKEPSRA
jgi:DUF1365 family protein